MLPDGHIDQHHAGNINPARQGRVRSKTVTLARLRNHATLMQLQNLGQEQMILLPGWGVNERGKLVRGRGHGGIGALDDRQFIRAAVGTA